MPAQDLRRGRLVRGSLDLPLELRRILVVAGSIGLSAFAAILLWRLLQPDGVTVLEGVTIGLSSVLCAWVAFGFISATAGFFIAWRMPSREPLAAAPLIVSRTAILMPVYNEDFGRVQAAIQAMWESLQAQGVGRQYDFYVLSDTRDPDVARSEATGVLRLRVRLGGQSEIYYRRRAANTARKAGNIADWVEGHGGAYEFMLVLDADSLMSGKSIVTLTAAMEADRKLGLLQSAPMIINAETPFARLHQFASWLYGPIFSLGQHWWSGSEGNYWGHNAIMRVRAFAQSAGLPRLSGPKPFGGHIQSHDFVEAALLRRAGWSVRMLPTLEGSYEETPPTLLDMARRDRRWCQGNLQHARLLTTAGLHWVSRMHLYRGVLSYLAAPLWLLLVACGSLAWRELETTGQGSSTIAWLFCLPLALLLAPKAMAVVLALRDKTALAGYGGRGRLLAGAAIEMLVSMLAAPITMMMQTTAVIEVLLGRDSGWGAQARDEGDTTAKQAWQAHRAHVGLGVLGALGAAFVDTHLLMWTSPVFVGLALSSILSVQTARAGTGHALRRQGLLQTPIEHEPPSVLVRALELRAAYEAQAPQRLAIDRLMRGGTPCYKPAPFRAPRVYAIKAAA